MSSSGDLVLVESAGNIGIGTTSPDTKLHVNGALTLNEMSTELPTPEAGTAVLFLRERYTDVLELVIRWQSGREFVLAFDPS